MAQVLTASAPLVEVSPVPAAHKHADRKEVVIVTGGPGPGKSVIALQLLGELYRRGVPALHATGSQSFTKTMRKVAGARKREVQDRFKYFNSFMMAEKNCLGALICDEAHRIREPGDSGRRTSLGFLLRRTAPL